ncbi:MAG: transcriptional regulator [Candidatus Desulforudis sp.]|nr:transcriptional regulator [Desulforudis sp.]
MFFGFGFQNKTVKELRKNQGLTARDLALLLRVDTTDILAVDKTKVKDVPEPLKARLIPILRGDHTDRIPW